jgi:hypothetical protein
VTGCRTERSVGNVVGNIIIVSSRSRSSSRSAPVRARTRAAVCARHLRNSSSFCKGISSLHVC